MISSETPRAGGAPRSADAQSWRKRITVVIATLLLAAGFGFAGASTATAAPAFVSSHAVEPPCRGDKPGICPNSSVAGQPNGQEPVHQSNDQSETQESNDQPMTTQTNEEPAAPQSPSS